MILEPMGNPCNFATFMKKLVSFITRKIPRKYLQHVSGLGKKVLTVLYAGNTVYCPVCNKWFRKFLPYGRLKVRENALCPNCLALERHRLLWLYLQQRTSFFDHPLDVLHIAPEACFVKPFEKIHGDRYITADMESPWAKVKLDVHHIPFEENKFDVVLCNHVLEHVADDIQAMREINRVLKPGGFAILQVPFFIPVPDVTFEDATITNSAEREKLFGQSDHARKYGRDYSSRIALSGLKPSEDKFVQELSEDERARYCLHENEIIYKAIKQPD